MSLILGGTSGLKQGKVEMSMSTSTASQVQSHSTFLGILSGQALIFTVLRSCLTIIVFVIVWVVAAGEIVASFSDLFFSKHERRG